MKNTTAIFLIILSLGLFFVFTKPYYAQVQETARTAGEYRNALENIENIIAERDRLSAAYNSIPKAEMERLSKALPTNVDTVRLAHELDSIGARYGITIKDVYIETKNSAGAANALLPEEESPYQKTTVAVSFVSNYEDFRKFIEDLEQSLRLMDVRFVKFTSGTGNNSGAQNSGLYEHNLEIETYWVK